eukprot:12381925-Ditylum_brightwellii.AAC.1
MSHESEDEYVLMCDLWESSKLKRKEESTDEEKKMITIYSTRKQNMKAVMKTKVMVRNIRKRKVMKKTLIISNLKTSYTGDIGDNVTNV